MGLAKRELLAEEDRENAKRKKECDRCNDLFNPEETSGSLCEYCAHMCGKDD